MALTSEVGVKLFKMSPASAFAIVCARDACLKPSLCQLKEIHVIGLGLLLTLYRRGS
jgi:hypothetical protein